MAFGATFDAFFLATVVITSAFAAVLRGLAVSLSEIIACYERIQRMGEHAASDEECD